MGWPFLPPDVARVGLESTESERDLAASGPTTSVSVSNDVEQAAAGPVAAPTIGLGVPSDAAAQAGVRYHQAERAKASNCFRRSSGSVRVRSSKAKAW